MTQPAQSAAHADTTIVGIVAVGRSPGWTIALGVLTLITGILIVSWPGPTLLVIAVLFGLQLLIAGIFRLVAALAMDELEHGSRVLFALLGILYLVAGILCLRSPFQTVAILALLLGLVWTVGGVIGIIHGIGGNVPSRGWAIASGVISAIAGIIVLVYPISSLLALSWLLGILFIVLGIFTIAEGIVAGRMISGASRVARVPRSAAS
ncbi:MAG TPA: DUF308 domain-containing protein [Pseudonocardiaceae bacterium]